ncbi:zinc finger protein 768-like [Melanotaenia boesemani]|uniref:zinc finger protein 768-like n=1 Tax=Melanotaenia boesemani TaxID=1250792 RepID=UPI001C049CED|nr:zinc finger protein 768-like [Melanotaenia boesemani]
MLFQWHHFLVRFKTVHNKGRDHNQVNCEAREFLLLFPPILRVIWHFLLQQPGLKRMSPAVAFHTQLASIMEVLANTAVAEICELVDNGYAVLQLEISRSRKENEVLRRKLRLMELRATRAIALRATANGCSGTALLHASGRPRVHLLAGHEPRRSGGTPRAPSETALSRLSHEETSSCRDPSPPPDPEEGPNLETPAEGETTAVIKVEDGESWSRPESDKGFCPVADGQTMETEASSSLIKQETADDGGSSSKSWTGGEVSSTSTQNAPNTSDHDSLMFEIQHGSCSTQNPPGADAGGPSALNPTASVSSLSAADEPAGFHSQQQMAPPPPTDEPTGRQSAMVRRDRWRLQNRASRDDSGGKTFICNWCGKTLACLKNLKTHMRVHTGEKPFVCALCGKRFSDSSNLKRHQSVHTGEKRYGCVHCGKRFAQSGSLKVHMSVHTDCKQFRCGFCGKTFISGSHLRRHITVHAGEKRFPAELL